MSKNQAVLGQFDLGVTPLTVSGASGMGDETHFWRTRRASVYKGADPGRPNWKSRVYRGTYPERPKWKSRFKPLDILGFDRVEDLRAKCWPQVNSKNRLPAVVRRPIAVTIRALADEPFTAQRQTHFAAHATAWRTPVRVRPGLGSRRRDGRKLTVGPSSNDRCHGATACGADAAYSVSHRAGVRGCRAAEGTLEAQAHRENVGSRQV